MATKKTPTSEPITLGSGENPVRLSFPDIFKAKKFDDESKDARFKATFLFDKSNAEHKATLKKIKEEGLKLIKSVNGDPSDYILCIADGDKKKYDGYAGCYYVNASNDANNRPVVTNRRNQPVAEGEPQAPYAGCYVRGRITLWLQNNKYGKKINANLRGVQFVKDGDAFGKGVIDADDEFEALEDTDETTMSGATSTEDEFDFA